MNSSMLHTLLLFACIRKATATSALFHHHYDTATFIVAPEARPVVEPAISPHRKLQGGNNNKNAGTGNGNAVNKNSVSPSPTDVPLALSTPAPSAAATVGILLPATLTPTAPSPTPFPTFPPPTLFPTNPQITLAPTFPPPTLFPTNPPTTFDPTFRPTTPLVTSSPSLAVKGYMQLQLSLFSPGVYALDIILGKNAPLVKALKTGVADILCTETDFNLVDASGQSVCTKRPVAPSSTSTSILRDDLVEMTVQDEQLPLLNFTAWTIQYPVVSVGQVYVDTAIANGVTPEDGGNDNGTNLQDAGIRMMERVGQLALLVELSSTDFDARLPEGVLASAVNQEVPTFLGQVGYTEQLDPAPLHGLRLAGLIMLAITSVATSLFVNLARSRKKEREWDERFKELASGGLVTEEGLDYLLDAGRSSQHQQQHQQELADRAEEMDSDDDNTNIPLPGAYMNVEYHHNKSP
jgi:hypothetical protein